jgi:hypothetical protein
MTRHEAVAKLRQFAENIKGWPDDPPFAERVGIPGTDPEDAHALADGILTALLEELGETEVVEAYEAISPKWYA